MATSYGVTPTGFKVKPRETIVEDMKTVAKSLFGENVNLSIYSPLGLFIDLLSWPIYLVWKALQSVYNSAFVDTATDQSLDYLGKYIGIARQQATKAIQVIRFTGDVGLVIPLNFKIQTESDPPIEFSTIETGTVPPGGTYIDLKAECSQAGSIGNQPAGTITGIKNPTLGLSAASNTGLDSEGLNRETDQEFRDRYRKSVSKGGASTIDAIRAAILDVDDVLDAVVIENDGDVADPQGRDPHSFESIVLGGTDADIARAIFNYKPAGIKPVGTTTVSVDDTAGNSHNVRFSRATEVSIYVTITTTTNSLFPGDGLAQIKDLVINYIGGIDSLQVYNRGLVMGASVIYNHIIMSLNVAGLEDITLKIGTAPNPNGTANIALLYNQKATTDLTKVVVS